MDDNFGNLIYFLILIVTFVISLLGKKKKKRPISVQQNGQFNRQEQTGNSFLPNLEQIIKQEMGIVDTNPYEEYNEPKIEKEIKEEPIDTIPKEYLDDKSDAPYSIEYDNNDLIKEDSIEQQMIIEEESETILEDFDLEQAIIFSEILNRKEY